MSRRWFLGATGLVAAGLALDACDGSRSNAHPAQSSLIFFDDFRRPPGPLGQGWTDAHRVDPTLQDEVGIVAGGVADVDLQGRADGDRAASGWRGAFFRETGVATGVRVITSVYLDKGQSTSGGGPLANIAPGSTPWGVGGWYNVGAGLNWYELGLIGRHPGDFQYLDTTFAPPPQEGGLFTIELRSADDQIAMFANGVRVGGPVPLPPELVHSTKHGGQMDVGSRAEQGVAQVRSVRIERTSGGATPDYSPAVIHPSRAVTKASAATSVALETPAGTRPGDLLIAVLGFGSNVTPAAPSGWQFYPAYNAGGAGPRLTCFSRYAGADEPSATTWRFGSSDVAAVLLRVSGANRRVPFLLAFQANPTGSAAPAPTQSIVGLHRLGLWAALAAADTTISPPDGFTDLARSPSGGAPLTLGLAQVPDWGRFSPPIRPPYGAGTKTVVPVGSLGTPAPSETMHLQVLPQPGTGT